MDWEGAAIFTYCSFNTCHFSIHTHVYTPFSVYNKTVQLLNRRNGNEESNFFPVFKLGFNELAGELFTHYCT
jgi:hypothetical protein